MAAGASATQTPQPVHRARSTLTRTRRRGTRQPVRPGPLPFGERLACSAISFGDQHVGVSETQPTDLGDSRTNEQHGRAAPSGQRHELQRVHHRRGGPHVDRGEALGRDVIRVGEIGAADVHRNDGVGIGGGDLHRQVVDGAAVDTDPAAHLTRWEEPGQRA